MIQKIYFLSSAGPRWLKGLDYHNLQQCRLTSSQKYLFFFSLSNIGCVTLNKRTHLKFSKLVHLKRCTKNFWGGKSTACDIKWQLFPTHRTVLKLHVEIFNILEKIQKTVFFQNFNCEFCGSQFHKKNWKINQSIKTLKQIYKNKNS